VEFVKWRGKKKGPVLAFFSSETVSVTFFGGGIGPGGDQNGARRRFQAPF
jgi:hypothetical protein